jgi:hypothetical protein
MCLTGSGRSSGLRCLLLSWSAAQILQAFAIGKWSFGAFRFMIKPAEPGQLAGRSEGGRPSSSLPVSGRSASGFNAGSSIGSAIASLWSRISRARTVKQFERSLNYDFYANGVDLRDTIGDVCKYPWPRSPSKLPGT